MNNASNAEVFEFLNHEHTLGIFSLCPNDPYLDCFALSSYTDVLGVQFFVFYTMYDIHSYYPKYLGHYAASEVFENAMARPPRHAIYERD